MAVLLLTNRQDYTADFVVHELQKRGNDYLRLNTEDIPTRVTFAWSSLDPSTSYLKTDTKHILLKNVTSIWYRRPVPPKPPNEMTDPGERQFAIEESRAAFGGMLRTLPCDWISHPDSLFAASFKIVQLKLAQELGFEVPATLVTNSVNDAQIFLNQFGSSSVYKPVGHLRGLSEDKVVFTNRLDATKIHALPQIRHSPVQFQTLIEKRADIRVTVVGERVFAAAIHSQSSPQTMIDWRRGVTSELEHSEIVLPDEIRNRCVNLVKALGLQFGAIDLILSRNGIYKFLEINGNGQWAWIEQLTDMPISSALVDLLTKSEN